jgi:hypothetical protein
MWADSPLQHDLLEGSIEEAVPRTDEVMCRAGEVMRKVLAMVSHSLITRQISAAKRQVSVSVCVSLPFEAQEAFVSLPFGAQEKEDKLSCPDGLQAKIQTLEKHTGAEEFEVTRLTTSGCPSWCPVLRL